MNQQPLWSGPRQTPNLQKTPHLYSWQHLTALILLYITSFILVGVGNQGTTGADQNKAFFSVLTNVGVILLLGINGFIIVIDRQNFFTLNGVIQWQRMKTKGRIALIFVYCCGWIMPILYLGFAVKLVIEARQQGRALKSHRQNNINQYAQASAVQYNPLRSQKPKDADVSLADKKTIPRTLGRILLKIVLYFVGAAIAEFGLFGGASTVTGGNTSLSCLSFSVGFLALVGSIVIFFRAADTNN